METTQRKWRHEVLCVVVVEHVARNLAAKSIGSGKKLLLLGHRPAASGEEGGGGQGVHCVYVDLILDRLISLTVALAAVYARAMGLGILCWVWALYKDRMLNPWSYYRGRRFRHVRRSRRLPLISSTWRAYMRRTAVSSANKTLLKLRTLQMKDTPGYGLKIGLLAFRCYAI